MIDLQEIKGLDDKTLVELYKRVVEHIDYLNSSIIELVEEEDEEEEDGEEDE